MYMSVVYVCVWVFWSSLQHRRGRKGKRNGISIYRGGEVGYRDSRGDKIRGGRERER